MDAYCSLWLIQQIPVLLLLLLLLTVGTLVGSKSARVVLLLGALGLGVGFGWELWSVFARGYPTAAGTWTTGWRWVLLGALLFVNHGPAQQFRLASVLAALALAVVGALIPAIVVVAFGMMERCQPKKKLLLAVVAGFGLAGALVHHKLLLWGVVASVFGTSIDGTTVITTLIIGLVELSGWLAAVLYPCASCSPR